MATLTQQQAKDYLNKTEFFKLKDFQATFDKWNSYKEEKYKEGVGEYNSYDCANDFELQLFNSNGFNQYRYMPEIVAKETTKSNIRQLATEINYIMSKSIEAHIKWIFDDDLNSNELRGFTIKYYLQWYKEINEAMHSLLEDYVLID